MAHDLYERSPVRALAEHLDGGLGAGQVGFIVARAGVGKSALLVHLSLDALLRDVTVLHVSLRDMVDHVRAYYDQIFRAATRKVKVGERAAAMVAAERHRMIHSYLDRDFDVGHLRDNLAMLRDIAQFRPSLIVVDGMDAESAEQHVVELVELAKALEVPVWFTSRPGTEEALWKHASLSLRLTPDGQTVKITLRKSEDGQSEVLPLSLDPTTMLVLGEDVWDPTTAPISPRPSDCTLYSGGANGAEAGFGEQAAKWGVHEVNFTFDGHRQARQTGRYELSPRELAAGDVSLVYVSKRLNRTYSEGSLIRRVLQTLWHMVSRSQQVFVIGQIQEDGTVVGGTGWSVELARMWNKSLWVFDQEKLGWFRWDGHDWVTGVPVIESIHFTGTGTRYLSEDGRTAIAELYERSFGRRLEDAD
jgi:hypothetical protein